MIDRFGICVVSEKDARCASVGPHSTRLSERALRPFALLCASSRRRRKPLMLIQQIRTRKPQFWNAQHWQSIETKPLIVLNCNLRPSGQSAPVELLCCPHKRKPTKEGPSTHARNRKRKEERRRETEEARGRGAGGYNQQGGAFCCIHHYAQCPARPAFGCPQSSAATLPP